ncbi:MAG: acyl-CoA thioesterase [Odoribacteraceae bacterium]|jgi:acyl-CoA thioester hydrolase|nr:acyl-CoA thioesterase [Odoribacteraceae bacterium]
MEYHYEHEMKARDYECDAQGVVNNANYLHYFEVSRHEFLEAKRVNFRRLREQGIDMMVARVDVRYKYPLQGGDRFVIRLRLQREGARLVVQHDLHRLPGEQLYTRCVAEIIALKDGRLTDGKIFDAIFAAELA